MAVLLDLVELLRPEEVLPVGVVLAEAVQAVSEAGGAEVVEASAVEVERTGAVMEGVPDKQPVRRSETVGVRISRFTGRRHSPSRIRQ